MTMYFKVQPLQGGDQEMVYKLIGGKNNNLANEFVLPPSSFPISPKSTKFLVLIYNNNNQKS